jgi:hypothetical protein
MKNTSTGFGLCVLGLGIAAWPVLDRLAPSANASAVTAAASAVSTAATAQTGPTIVWYQAVGGGENYSVFRAWTDGRIEVIAGAWKKTYISSYDYCYTWQTNWLNDRATPGCTGAGPGWQVVSDPAQGLTYRSDINFDEKVDGADLGQLLADWGNAPRQDIPPSDCPLALINP